MNTSRHLSLLVPLVLDAVPPTSLSGRRAAGASGDGVGRAGHDQRDRHDLQLPRRRHRGASMEGQTTRYRRARPYAPSAVELQAFAGRYESDELRAVMQIAPWNGGLTVRVNESPTQVVELGPVDPDTFQRGMQAVVRFRRDQAGRVMGLRLQYSSAPQRQIHAAERPRDLR